MELSQGDHGSNFIKERIKYGLIGSNYLVKRGLGLPKSLLSILLTGNLFIRDVLLTLVEHDETARDEVNSSSYGIDLQPSVKLFRSRWRLPG